MTGREPLPAFRKMGAWAELRILREYPLLMPCLLTKGLGAEDARALAYNATLLFQVLGDDSMENAGQVLERYSLGEIAALCEAYRQVAAGELEYGEKEGGPWES